MISDKQVTSKQKYKNLKRKLKLLLYEQECFLDELRKSERKMIKVQRDKNFLLDRLMQFERVEDSSGDSDSTISSGESDSDLPSLLQPGAAASAAKLERGSPAAASSSFNGQFPFGPSPSMDQSPSSMLSSSLPNAFGMMTNPAFVPGSMNGPAGIGGHRLVTGQQRGRGRPPRATPGGSSARGSGRGASRGRGASGTPSRGGSSNGNYNTTPQPTTTTTTQMPATVPASSSQFPPVPISSPQPKMMVSGDSSSQQFKLHSESGFIPQQFPPNSQPQPQQQQASFNSQSSAPSLPSAGGTAPQPLQSPTQPQASGTTVTTPSSSQQQSSSLIQQPQYSAANTSGSQQPQQQQPPPHALQQSNNPTLSSIQPPPPQLQPQQQQPQQPPQQQQPAAPTTTTTPQTLAQPHQQQAFMHPPPADILLEGGMTNEDVERCLESATGRYSLYEPITDQVPVDIFNDNSTEDNGIGNEHGQS